jgi:two-component system LytT family sensor kinase
LLTGALLTRFLAHEYVVPWERLNDPVRYAKEVKQFWIPSRIIRLAVQYYPAIAFMTLFELMRRANIQEKLLRNAERERSIAELNFLKAQINPHFFFNTLNTLYSLILQGSTEAAKLVMHLSNLMRYMLEQTKADKVTLATEIAELENYIRIEQLRFDDRLDLSFVYSGDIAGNVIMPLTLLPFAENAFKHGVENGQAWVAIDIKVTSNQLFYSVVNSRPVQKSVPGSGIGLANLRRRLELTYPGRYTISINEQSDIFEAVLKIEL